MDTSERYPQVVLARGGAWCESELIRRGYTSGGLANARRTFGIIAWRDPFGGWHFPRWQFDADGKVLPQVIEILRLFKSRDTLYVMSQFLFSITRAKSLIELICSGRGETAVNLAKERVRELRSEPKLSRKQLRDLARRLRGLRDQVRFVVVSSFLRRWVTVYDVSNNVYCHDHIAEGCLIKDRRIAEAIVKQLRGKARSSDLHVLPVRKTKGGYCALENLPATKGEEPCRPRFRTPNTLPVFVPITESGTRENFVDAMMFATQHREDILRLLSQCRDRKAAREQLVNKCGVSPPQAETILDMRLNGMTKESVKALKDELRKAVRASA